MRRVVSSVAILFVLTGSALTFAEKEAAPTKYYNLGPDKLALGGYDPVSYFGAQKPSMGSKDITAEVEGVVYRFASSANRDKFLAEPQKYRPAYGGWCATAMAAGKKVEVNPLNYRVTDGRLFLFYKSVIHDAQDDWKKDEPGSRDKADMNWKRISADQRERS